MSFFWGLDWAGVSSTWMLAAAIRGFFLFDVYISDDTRSYMATNVISASFLENLSHHIACERSKPLMTLNGNHELAQNKLSSRVRTICAVI